MLSTAVWNCQLFDKRLQVREMISFSASNECADRSFHTCDENADCIDTPDAYICHCYAGYVDVSSGANLPPGRVCTVDTTCPKQKTDLMFLIDGSGSIGSYVFKHEVSCSIDSSFEIIYSIYFAP